MINVIIQDNLFYNIVLFLWNTFWNGKMLKIALYWFKTIAQTDMKFLEE